MTPLQQIAHYRITAKLGEGGMGEVYRATDTKLGREVAIKVLPESFARDPGRMARFEREAQVLASLNHPNIAQIYGVEDRALVMELVEGESPRGPMPFDEAAKIGLEMAEALEYAHDKGIVHRDLKPANIKITSDSAVKLLDFGLAKAFANELQAPAHRENSPTLTMGATEVGVILGTASYMSPEQAAAKPVDKRADIWSFGVVLWELLTGERLFDGETISHTLADVLRAPIDFGKLPKAIPGAIRTLLQRCLDRNVKTRLRDIGEARVAIQNCLSNPAVVLEKNEAASSKVPGRFAMFAALAGVVLGATATWLWFHQPVPNAPSLRLEINPPANAKFGNFFAGMAVSPNGRMVVFSAQRDGVAEPSLWLRALDSLDARELPGTERGTYPFWSPESNSVGFFAGDKLKRIDVSAGPPQILCDARVPGGGSWSKEGVILFSTHGILQKIPASGGGAEPVMPLNASVGETNHRNPEFLPDGHSFLFLIASENPATQGIYASRLDPPGERTKLVTTTANAAYAPPAQGHPAYLLWMRDSTLVAQPFDGSRLRVVGDPVPVVETVAANRTTDFMNAGFGSSSNGLLAYWSGVTGDQQQLIWMTREGAREVLMDIGRHGDPHFSPDGERVALERDLSSTGTGSFDIWIYELKRKLMTRLTFGPIGNIRPVWSPDGRQIAFASRPDQGVYQLFRKNADGAGTEEQMTRGPYNRHPTSWSPDGRYLLFREQHPRTGVDIWLLPLEGDHKPIPFAQSRFNEDAAQFSPDGKWIAYSSDETGRPEIFIQPFPATGAKWQVSDQGGELPKWRRDGKDLYFYSGGKIRAAPLRLQAGRVEIDRPRDLFALTRVTGPLYFYDVASDGQRFLVSQPAADGRGALRILTNWWSVLKP